MRSPFYVLGGSDGHTPVPVDVETFARHAVMPIVHVGFDRIGNRRVSTVFLGMQSDLSAPPRLFETMVFCDEDVEGQWRYVTWSEAEAGHRALVEQLKKALP